MTCLLIKCLLILARTRIHIDFFFSQELELLGMLYGLFQKFIRFDDQFRDTLWSEIDLQSSNREVSYTPNLLSDFAEKISDLFLLTEQVNTIKLFKVQFQKVISG